MVNQLLTLGDYCVFTFSTTSYALKAEKELKNAEAEFIIMPTLREISSSCGLSVKIHPDNREKTREILAARDVPFEAVYLVHRQDKHNEVIQLEQVN